MKIDPNTGLLEKVNYLCSPNQDHRPESQDVSLLVVHNISLPPGEYGNGEIQKFFLNQLNFTDHKYYSKISHLKVSCHLFIDRDGNIIQFVPFHKRAWHAGQSSFRGKTDCNNFSIGIELEGVDTEPFTTEQYDALITCSRAIMKAYPKITYDNVVGHSDIAPGRKTDPGPSFDWSYYREHLALIAQPLKPL